jgi:hypothetical protein
VAEGAIGLVSDFSHPIFDLFRDLSILDHLYEGLAKHGLKLSDMRFETTGSFGDIHVLAYLFNFAVVVRIRLDKIEIQSLVPSRVDLDRLTNVVEEVFRAVRTTRSDLGFAKHTLTFDLHGSLEGQSAPDFISRYATGNLERLGPSVGKGAVFYFGAEGVRLMSSLTLDLSQRVVEGLYLRAYMVWDGQRLQATELGSVAGKHLEEVFKTIDLEIRRE